MRRSLLVLIASLSMLVLQAQNQHSIDSLRRVLAAHPKEDTLRANTLYQLSREYWDRDLDTAFILAGDLLRLSKRINYIYGVGDAYNSMGVVRWYQGNYPDAQHYHELALKARTATGRKLAMAATWHNLGLVNDDQGNYPEALKFYLHAMKLYEEQHDTEGVSQEHSMIAVIHYNQKDYTAALKEHQRALALREATQDLYGLTETYSNLGITYFELKDFAEAEKWYAKALALRERIDDQQGIAISLNNYGDLYREQKRYAEALATLDKSQAINERLGYRKSVADVLLNKARVYVEQGDLRKALEHQRLSLQVSEQVGATDQVHLVLSELATTAAQLGDYPAAYQYRLRHEQIGDSMFNKQRTRSLVQQQMRYDFDKKALADSLTYASATAIRVKEIQKQKLVRNGALLGFVLMVAFAAVFFLQRNRISREKKRSDDLLLNILPASVAEELKEKGAARTRNFDEITVLFTDFKDFTGMAEQLPPEQLVAEIDACFRAFDGIVARHGVEKIKTIGDAYMAAGGLPELRSTHAHDVVRAALEMRAFVDSYAKEQRKRGLPPFEIRLGVHSGPVVAGIVGVKKFAYDIWGDTVNVAARMESSGEVGRVNISGSTYALVKEAFVCTPRGRVEAKNKGWVDMYFVEDTPAAN